jgi:hypothetical protein
MVVRVSPNGGGVGSAKGSGSKEISAFTEYALRLNSANNPVTWLSDPATTDWKT